MAAHAVGEIADALLLVLLGDLTLAVLMAVVTGIGGVAVGMAGGAGPARPAVVQGEAVGTIERGRAPGAGRMAQAAIEPE